MREAQTRKWNSIMKSKFNFRLDYFVSLAISTLMAQRNEKKINKLWFENEISPSEKEPKGETSGK